MLTHEKNRKRSSLPSPIRSSGRSDKTGHSLERVGQQRASTDQRGGSDPAPRRFKWIGLWSHPASVLVIATLYLAPFVYRGWIPHDQGTLAQCAERLLGGELPHRDFDAMYTGGLSFLNALAFVLFGVKMSSIRTMFFLFTLAFVLVFHWLCRRMLSPGLATLTTYVAVAWSVPNYFAAMPSWYNLYFATFGAAAIVKFIDDSRLRWLALAGFWGGVSVIFKITGLYYIAAVLMFLAFRAHSQNDTDSHADGRARWLSSAWAASASAVWLALVITLIRSQLNVAVFAQLVLPSIVVGAVWSHQAYRFPFSRSGLRQLVGNTAVFAAGLLAPMVPYALLYVWGGALPQLIHGVFVTPLERVDSVTYPLPQGPMVLMAMVALSGMAVLAFKRPRWDLVIAAILIVSSAVFMQLPAVLTRDNVFILVRLAPVGFAISCGLRLIQHHGEMTTTERQQHFLLLALAACLPLIQFPFAAPIYFCFVFPLLLLQAQAVYVRNLTPPLRAQWAATVLLLVFGVIYVNNITFFDDPRLTAVDPPINPLRVSRAGLLVTERDADVYEPLVSTIQRHSQLEDYVLAFPDCPEVYFLAERKNRSRTLFDVFDAKKGSRIEQLTAAEQPRPKVLVINGEPKHSRKLTEKESDQLRQLYRQCEQIGPFLVCFD